MEKVGLLCDTLKMGERVRKHPKRAFSVFVLYYKQMASARVEEKLR